MIPLALILCALLSGCASLRTGVGCYDPYLISCL